VTEVVVDGALSDASGLSDLGRRHRCTDALRQDTSDLVGRHDSLRTRSDVGAVGVERHPLAAGFISDRKDRSKRQRLAGLESVDRFGVASLVISVDAWRIAKPSLKSDVTRSKNRISHWYSLRVGLEKGVGY